MTPKQIKDILKTKFDTDITQAGSIPTQFDNVEFDQPEDDLWIRFSVLPGGSLKMSVGAPGSNITRHIGIIVAEIFSPLSKGDKAAYDTADLIRAAFIPGGYSGVTVRTGSTSSQGRVTSWWKVNYTIPYQSDELT